MKHYLCFYDVVESDYLTLESKNWANYVRYSLPSAMELYNKWVKLDEVAVIGIVEVETNVDTWTTTSTLIHHLVKPTPKKVIYNKQANIKPKLNAAKAIQWMEDVASVDPINWGLVHQLFANQQ